MIKRMIGTLMLVAFAASVIGCEASAKVGDPDDRDMKRSGTSYEKKTTTTRDPDGDVRTKTETKVDR